MLKSPEIEQGHFSLEEAKRFLFGTLLVEPRLKNAILEAFNNESPILEKERLKEKHLIDPRYQKSAQEAYALYCQAWEGRRDNFLTKILFSPSPTLEQLKNSIQKNSDRLINELIISPLYAICVLKRGQRPNFLEPWLGQLLIEAAEDTPETQPVRQHLSLFGLNPKVLVEEVRNLLTQEQGKDKIKLP